MRIFFSVLFIVVISGSLFAQENGFTFLNVREEHPSVPQSPEVAAFQKYGNNPVDLYTGTPSIGIPIYVFEGVEIKIPISLSYDASGIKGSQLATKVGLGWNFNFGGIVSRQINGLADDKFGLPQELYDQIWDDVTQDAWNTIFDSNNGITEVYQTYNSSSDYSDVKAVYDKYLNNEIDFQADLFPFFVNGMSGVIAIDYQTTVGSDVGADSDYAAYCLENPSIIVKGEWASGELLKWIITSSSGTTYEFSKREVTWQDYSDPVTAPNGGNEYTRIHTSAWYLTEVISPNGLDKFNYNYTNIVGDFWTDPYDFNSASAVRTEAGEDLLGNNTRKIKQFYLTSITYNDNPTPIFTTQTGPRADINGIDRYTGFNVNDYNGNPILQVDLDNDQYFSSSYIDPPTPYNSRLKLDGIKFYRDALSTDQQKYSFDYHLDNNDFPFIFPRNNHSVDYWGYFNNKNNPNNTLIPKDIDNGYLIGVDRSPSFNNILYGALSSITYPTGGKTTFYFEPHNGFGSNLDGIKTVDGSIGGLRLQKQVSDPNDGGPTLSSYYYYGDIVADSGGNPNNITINSVTSSNYSVTGIPQQELIFFEVKNIDSPTGQFSRHYQYASNLASITPHKATYSTVSEISFNGSTFSGCTVTEFYNEIYTGAELKPIRPFYNQNLTNGEVFKHRTYDNALNLLVELENELTNELLPQQNSLYAGFMFNQPVFTPAAGQSGCESAGPDGQGGYEFSIVNSNSSGNCTNGGTLVDYYSKYKIQPFGFRRYRKRLDKITSRTYQPGYSNPIVEVSNHLYNSNNHYFASDIVVSDSKGGASRTKIFYPSDGNLLTNYPTASLNVLNDLTLRNQISSAVEWQRYYAEDEVSGLEVLQTKQRKRFQIIGSSNGRDIVRPERVEMSKGVNGTLKAKLLYQSFYANGNPQEIRKPSGLNSYYIWGYDDRLLIAEIQNKNGSFPTDLQNLIDQAINYSNGEDSEAEEIILRSYLDNIRNHTFLSKSQVTTYTHDPGIGLTSQISPRGFLIKYKYDEHGRLKETRDSNNKLLTSNDYNFRINN